MVWAIRIGLVLLAVVAAFCAFFYAWIDVAAPGHARLNHALGIICMWAVPTLIVGATTAAASRRGCRDGSPTRSGQEMPDNQRGAIPAGSVEP
jgi:hypothetical protein